jgi:hypothetical protein
LCDRLSGGFMSLAECRILNETDYKVDSGMRRPEPSRSSQTTFQ